MDGDVAYEGLVVKAVGLKVAAAVRKGDEEVIMLGIWYNGYISWWRWVSWGWTRGARAEVGQVFCGDDVFSVDRLEEGYLCWETSNRQESWAP
jgi:hypothetical protein